jgi:hypothetical protein
MNNITKIAGGFEYQNQTFYSIEIDGLLFQILSESQVHIYTDLGVILLDLSCTINEGNFDDIHEFTNYLLW